MASINTKEELAELFNLLTSARPRQQPADFDTIMEAGEDAPRRNKRLSQPPPPPRAPEKRMRRNTVAHILAQKDTNIPFDVTMNDAKADADAASLTDGECPTDLAGADAKQYAFGFKLPIYKLYDKSEWAKTVRETLESSKDRFKPLAEQVVYAGAKENDVNDVPVGKDGSAVRFKVPVPPQTGGRARRASAVTGRTSTSTGRARSGSASQAMSPGARPMSPSARPMSPATRPLSQGARTMPPSTRPVSRGARTMPPAARPMYSTGSALSPDASRTVYPRSPAVCERPEVRALKKRCVGRRRSMTVVEDAGNKVKPRGTWVYSASVSAAERPIMSSFSAFPPAPPSTPMVSQYPSMLGTVNTAQDVPGTAVNQAAGHKRRVSVEGPAMLTPGPRMMMPLGQGSAKDRMAARRRALALDFEDEGCEIIERGPWV